MLTPASGFDQLHPIQKVAPGFARVDTGTVTPSSRRGQVPLDRGAAHGDIPEIPHLTFTWRRRTLEGSVLPETREVTRESEGAREGSVPADRT
ncbi:hypothetical protein Acsp03_51090 [Actinomadura sp. NBRC 104412]|nr:hypothetical protein Acsp03_51090 [Actinomadura sp. NBRC 104412]